MCGSASIDGVAALRRIVQVQVVVQGDPKGDLKDYLSAVLEGTSGAALDLGGLDALIASAPTGTIVPVRLSIGRDGALCLLATAFATPFLVLSDVDSFVPVSLGIALGAGPFAVNILLGTTWVPAVSNTASTVVVAGDQRIQRSRLERREASVPLRVAMGSGRSGDQDAGGQDHPEQG